MLITDVVYYADDVPEAVVSGAQALRQACDAWPHQTTAPDLSVAVLIDHLSICYALRHPGYLADATWNGVGLGVAGTALAASLLLVAALLAARMMRRRWVRQPPPISLKAPLERVIHADRERERVSRTLDDLHEEIEAGQAG